MFFVKEMERSITLHPSFVGTNIKPYLKQEVQRDVEGKVEDSHLIICVLDDYTFSEGRVLPGGGKVEYTAHFKALVWKPFKMEVMDGVCGNVTDTGFFVHVGPLEVFISRLMIMAEVNFDPQASPPCWTDGDDLVISKGKAVRFQLRSVRPYMGRIAAIGSVKEDYLGPFSE